MRLKINIIGALFLSFTGIQKLNYICYKSRSYSPVRDIRLKENLAAWSAISQDQCYSMNKLDKIKYKHGQIKKIKNNMILLFNYQKVELTFLTFIIVEQSSNMML